LRSVLPSELNACRNGAEMIGNQKSTDPGLSSAERKEVRGREAKEAIADHEEGQRALQENLERLRAERLLRETASGPMLYPALEIPGDTPIDNVRFSTRIRNALTATGWTTVSEIREASDATLLGLPNLGNGSVAHLRETLGLPSKDGVCPAGRKAKGKKMPNRSLLLGVGIGRCSSCFAVCCCSAGGLRVKGKMTMKALTVFAAVCFLTSAYAQDAAPKVGNKPLTQVKPKEPMGCKLVGTVRGIKLWAGDCMESEQLRGAAPATDTQSLPERATGAIPPGSKQ
jgi:RNA polymerase alpha subunit